MMITKHIWAHDVTKTYQHCQICGQVTGQGMWEVFPCQERFDWDRFNKWLQFHNFSKVLSKSKITRYAKRYTDQIFTEKQLLKQYGA